MRKKVTAADLFCGAGGTSTGLAAACARLGLGLDLLAINHWALAIATHGRNHPWARHICWPIEQVQPKRAIPNGRLDLLWASPECTHHSIARGGRPVSDQKRAGAWEICRWATELRIENLIVENVREFQDWGPIGSNGRPLKSRKGETFRAWITALESLDYRVESRVLNCADYGDPTSRRRLFVLAKRGRGRIEWPKPTHGDGLAPWRTAREIIDWELKGQSIFNRARPLKQRTIDRIAAGLRKFGGAAAEPFLVMLYGTPDARSVHRPAPTVTARGQHVGICEPFLMSATHSGSARVHSAGAPMPTVTCAKRGEIALVEPFILPPEGVHRGNAARSLDAPLQTVLASRGAGALVEPFLVAYRGDHAGRRDGENRVHSVNEPLRTQDTSNRYGLCEPFLLKYNGNGVGAHEVGQPLPTATTKERFGLVEPVCLDILFRMLQPHELAAAQGFPAGYYFAGNKEQVVKQIGNAVPTNTAAALAEAQLAA